MDHKVGDDAVELAGGQVSQHCARAPEGGRWMWSGGGGGTHGAAVVVAALDEAFKVAAGLFGGGML